MIKIPTAIFLMVLLPFSAHCQTDSANYIKYTPDFKFIDGIFINFEQVKNNDPIPVARILTTVDYNDKDFFDIVFSKAVISYYDNFGIKQDVETKKIWGFSKNGILHILYKESFNRISIVGRICHFIAMVSSYNSNYMTPYNYYPYYNPYYYPYANYPANSKTTELKQFVLDFDTGTVMEYTVKNLEILLMKDTELYDEYSQLRKKKKKQLKFYYIRKFNEKNPLYIKVNNN